MAHPCNDCNDTPVGHHHPERTFSVMFDTSNTLPSCISHEDWMVKKIFDKRNKMQGFGVELQVGDRDKHRERDRDRDIGRQCPLCQFTMVLKFFHGWCGGPESD